MPVLLYPWLAAALGVAAARVLVRALKGSTVKRDDPIDPLVEISHREIPDLTEEQHELAVKAIYKLPPGDRRRELADLFETAPKREGHPRPQASLNWGKAGERGCSEVDLIFDLAHSQGD